MTYDSREKSQQDGAPVELYEFARNTKVWKFTSAVVDLDLSSDGTYTSAPIDRTEVASTQEQARNAVELTVPRTFAIADLYRIAPPTDIISLTIKRFHREEEDDTVVVWKGRLLNCSFEGARAVLKCEPISSSLKRLGLRRLYQKQCPHPLYGEDGCKVDKEAHKIDTTITNIDGVNVTVGALLSRPYAGGYIEREDADGNFERRFIRSFTGLVLTLAQRLVTASVSDAVTVFPGCDHTMQTCDEVYDNILNFGGMPFIPQKNPFDGTPIF